MHYTCNACGRWVEGSCDCYTPSRPDAPPPAPTPASELDALRAERDRLHEALLEAHEFVCNVDIHGDWWDSQRLALAAELDRLLAAPPTPRGEEPSR